MHGRRMRLTMLLALCSTFGMSVHSIAAEIRPPNIVLIFADDLGWKDVGYQESRLCQTPRIDQLAQEGMVFTNGYAAAGNCAPSRACLLSGTYTPRHHVFAVGSTNRGSQKKMRLIPVPNRSGLPKENVTLADALKAAGYATACFGKWHLAGRDGALPTEQGFDVTYDSFGDGKLKEGSEGNHKGPPEDPKGVYTLTNLALDFMKSHREELFFCYLSHHAIHTPLQARPETIARLRTAFPDHNDKQLLYAACTYDLDDSVGRLLDGLSDLGLAEKTLVVFTSDNGATPASPQEPLRGNKGCYYEGGIREPFIVRWPGVVAKGSKCDVPVINTDLFPTFLAAAKTDVPAGKILDGESLLPLLMQTGPLQRQAIFWHFPGYLNRPVIRGRDKDFRTRAVSVIRQGDWKLHLYHEEWLLDGGRKRLTTNHAVELYNLKDDIGERNDLALVRPDKRDELIANLLTWMKQTDAPWPKIPDDARPQRSGGKSKAPGK